MGKFKVGDRIRRIRNFEKWAPEGYETTVLQDHCYTDKFGSLINLSEEQWELVSPEIINNYQIF